MSGPNKLKICAICEHENPASAEVCERCGAPLAESTTLSVPEELREMLAVPPIPGSSPPVALARGDIALSIPGSLQPIVLRGETEYVLGRQSPSEPTPTVDLSANHAHLLGVSRRHASIRFSSGRYAIQDLSSSNGTWLNDHRLPPFVSYPLHDGDQIRLAQLVMYVHLPGTEPLAAP